jgi:hypothetical protein
MLPFNTSAFSNTLGATDRATQRKALVTPLKDKFDGKPEDVLRHIADFNHRCKEAGVVEDFRFIVKENTPPSTLDLSDPVDRAKWHSNPDRFQFGNILPDSSQATIEKLQHAQDEIRASLSKLSSQPDPKQDVQASNQLVSFQNHEWIYILLQTVSTSNMKAIMHHYDELHDQDGVVLWFCFLNHFAGTTTENLIEAYSHLTKTKIQLFNFNGNVLQFTNYIRNPIRRLMKAKETPTFQHFLYAFHGAMDVPNEEFRAFIIALYTDYRKGGPTKHLSMVDLRDQLDTEYNRINNLGLWVKKNNNQILALTASLHHMKSQLSSLQTRYAAFMASKDPPMPNPTKLNKPPPHKPGGPEIIDFKNRTWKWCGKCFGGSWNRTHITEEHQPGNGRNKNKKAPVPTDDKDIIPQPPPTPTDEANKATTPPEAHLAETGTYDMDFL